MGYEWFRKRIKELQEKGLLGSGNTAPELPGMADPYESMNQSATGTYTAPEIVEPTIPEPTIPEPETQPIYEPEEDLNIPAAVPAVNTASQSANSPATAPELGEAGSKALNEILRDVSEYYKEERSKALNEVYNAGLNGMDITQEIRDDAAVGDYLGQIEAMYNAGLQDAAASNPVDDVGHEKVDKPENLGYTAGNTTGKTGTDTVDPVEYTDTAETYEVPNTSSTSSSTSSSASGSGLSQEDLKKIELELNYMMDMLFMNGAASSSISSVQELYRYVSNPDNKDKEITPEISDAFYAFMSGISDHQIAKLNHSAAGKDDELGFVKDIYEAKKENQQKPSGLTDAETQKLRLKFYYSTGKPSPPTTYDLEKLYEYLNISLGEAGQTVLGEIIKPDPEAYGKRSGILLEAYKAGLMGYDFSKESINTARGEGYLGDVLKMYQAGETDKKIAEEKAELDKLRTSNNVSPDSFEWTADANYYKSVLSALGAANSNDSNAQLAYNYFKDPANKGKKEVPDDIKNAFCSYLSSINQKVIENFGGENFKGLQKGDIIPTGVYAGSEVSQGFNDLKAEHYDGHMAYDILIDGGSTKKVFTRYLVELLHL